MNDTVTHIMTLADHVARDALQNELQKLFTPLSDELKQNSHIVISETVLLTSGVTACSSAFIQFSPHCPDWVAQRVANYISSGFITLKTAKIGETE